MEDAASTAGRIVLDTQISETKPSDIIIPDDTHKMTNHVLPNSVPREIKGFTMRNGIPWINIFCANCGCDGGQIPEDTKDFAFYLCVACGEKWAPLAGTYLVPDEVFWEKVKQVQLDEYGRILQDYEIIEALKDGNHVLSKLVKERYNKP